MATCLPAPRWIACQGDYHHLERPPACLRSSGSYNIQAAACKQAGKVRRGRLGQRAAPTPGTEVSAQTVPHSLDVHLVEGALEVHGIAVVLVVNVDALYHAARHREDSLRVSRLSLVLGDYVYHTCRYYPAGPGASPSRSRQGPCCTAG